MAVCWICGQEEPAHDYSKHGPVCSQHKCPPYDCFRVHNPQAFRNDDDLEECWLI